MNPEMERLLELVSQVAQKLGDDITTEHVSDEPIIKDGKLEFFLNKKTAFVENGAIKDVKDYGRRLFSCGHIASKDSFGSVCSSPTHDYKRLPVLNKGQDPATPFVACKHCVRRCIRCKKVYCLFCITSVPSLPGVCFCKSCARRRKIGDFFLRR